jgi:acetyl/propionyl-CoA carboxylase alpha subunit
MSAKIQGRVGDFELEWLQVPTGGKGRAQVRLRNRKTGLAEKSIEVGWAQDALGLWLELENQVIGYDIVATENDEGGECFDLKQRQGCEVIRGVQFYGLGDDPESQVTVQKKKGKKVKAQMPGKIVKILVEEGQSVERDQSLLVMEAMKMENEIKATESGVIKVIRVKVGQAIESGAELLVVE